MTAAHPVKVGAVAAVLMLALAPSLTPRALAGEPPAAAFVRVRIDQVTPDVVTATSQPTVTVSGMVTNIGDRPVRDVVVRLEHGPAIAGSASLRTALQGTTDQFQPAADFLAVAPELQRGQEVGFTLSAPLRALQTPSLGVEKPGIYPVLVNVNGTPDYGAPARLDDARFLLPAVGVPPDGAGEFDSAVTPDASQPVLVTMLWPLADRPRLAPGAPGGTLPVRLVDDDLAASLGKGGRLDALLTAAEVATGHDVDPDGAVGRALCLTVDPDLLVTVNAMTAGYVVSDSPATQQPGTATHPGTGQGAATDWLNRLRALAHHMCVAPLPYAQADLDALQRVNDARLGAFATAGAGGIVDRILDIGSVGGATLLPDGTLTDTGVALLGAGGDAGGGTVAVAAAADTSPRRLSPQVVLAAFDPSVGAALAGAGTSPSVPTYLDSSLAVRLAHDSETARRQDALGSILWHCLQSDAAPRTQLLVPPATWSLRAEDAQAMLAALATGIHAGLTVGRPLPGLIAEANSRAEPPGPADVLPAAPPERGRFDDDVTADIAAQVGRLWGLTAALSTDERTGLSGVAYTAPLREDTLRALSQAAPPDTRNGLARERLAVVGATINDLFGAVTIVNPGSSYTLATEHSPLPLALHNGLAVPIQVRLQIDAPPGMTITNPGVIELPPGYLPLRVPVEVKSNQLSVIDVALRTPDGVHLGDSVRLSVHSNAYGKVLFAITLSAAAVLALLTGRRLWHRFRGQPDRADRADLDRPR